MQFVIYISNTKICTADTEAIQFGLNFGIEIKSQNIVNLISQNYRYSDPNFIKRYIQGLIIAATKLNITEYI